MSVKGKVINFSNPKAVVVTKKPKPWLRAIAFTVLVIMLVFGALLALGIILATGDK